MAGTERIRHCHRCDLNVYNLTAMTRDEAQSLVDSTEGRLCTRFYRRQDGTILTRDCRAGNSSELAALASVGVRFGVLGSLMAATALLPRILPSTPPVVAAAPAVSQATAAVPGDEEDAIDPWKPERVGTPPEGLEEGWSMTV